MAATEQDLRSLLTHPRESLDLELKQWINPLSNEGIAKIARACIALRNNNGGWLVIGFQNDGQPDLSNVPTDVKHAFQTDVIQSIVSRYSAEPFTVETQFVDVGGQSYPVITVPSGVMTPVAAKSDLAGGPNGKPLIRDHAVYVRSVNSNNTVSSTEGGRGDWNGLRICFDNREADIGGFVRRHLAALNFETLAALAPAFAGLVARPTTMDRVLQELNRGRSRFQAMVTAPPRCHSRSRIPRVGDPGRWRVPR